MRNAQAVLATLAAAAVLVTLMYLFLFIPCLMEATK
mgnify:CR=1 FL=1